MSALIGIIDCNISNLTSVVNAFSSLGIATRIVGQAKNITGCSHLILPGVGSFAAGITNIRATGMDDVIRERVKAGTPLLGICLGMQLLADIGAEFGPSTGLGLIAGGVDLIQGAPRLPHIGWNDLSILRPSKLFADIRDPVFYFVHSHAYTDVSADEIVAVTEYGGPIVASVERDNVYGVQFHPEKSQQAGLALLRNFATQC